MTSLQGLVWELKGGSSSKQEMSCGNRKVAVPETTICTTPDRQRPQAWALYRRWAWTVLAKDMRMTVVISLGGA